MGVERPRKSSVSRMFRPTRFAERASSSRGRFGVTGGVPSIAGDGRGRGAADGADEDPLERGRVSRRRRPR